jgi:glycosyltransferase involved in cell wall biosynthesis
MKIAIFSDTFPPKTDGVANVVYQSAKYLANLGHKVAVFTVLPKEKKRPDNFSDNGFTVFALPSLSSSIIYPESRFTIPIGISLKHLRKFKPDIIHTHIPFAVGWEAVLAAKILHIPLVGTHHTFFEHYLKYAKMDYEWGKKFSWKYTVGYYNRCDLVLSPSRSLANALLAQGLKKPTAVLQNSIDIDLFKPIPSEEKKDIKEHFGISGQSLVYMGRIGYEKSIDQVIRSLALMLKKMPELKLMIIGDGPDKDKLERLANDLGTKKNIIFTGYLFKEKLAKVLGANDIFITASKSENMPLSVLEAMAVGLPVIAVKEKGLAEIIKDGLNGFFAKTDDPENLAQKTLTLLSDTERLKKFSEASRNLSLEYSHEKVTHLLEDLYKKVLK